MDGPRVGRPAHTKFRDPPTTHLSQRNGQVALDPRSGHRNGSARLPVGGSSNHKVDDSAANIDDHR